MNNARSTTKVFVRDFVVEAHIGVYDHEKNRKQPLRVNCTATLKPSGAWVSDKIEDTFSYELIVKAIQDLGDGQHIELVEVFAERLAAICLQSPSIQDVTVKIEKIGYYTQGVVGTEIFRSH